MFGFDVKDAAKAIARPVPMVRTPSPRIIPSIGSGSGIALEQGLFGE